MTEHGERGATGRVGPAGAAGETGDTGLTGQAGEPGTTGDTGETGAQGAAGPAGRQGEAGVSGRQGEAGTAGLRGATGQRGKGSTPLSRWQSLAVLGVVLVAFTTLAVLFQRQSGDIRENQQRIANNQRQIVRTQYDQCTLRDEGVVRQNALIDAAIAAEKRKGAAADPRRIRDLTDFKGTVIDCGTPPP